MTNARHNSDRQRPLSRIEVTVLAAEALERARQALHEDSVGDGTGSRTAEPANARTRSGTLAAITMRSRAHFEYLTIGCCLVLSGAAWLAH